MHFLLPFIILALVVAHLVALHYTGSTQRLGAAVSVDKIPFHPYFTLKDMVGFFAFFVVISAVVCFMPNELGHPDNYLPADPLVTPAHIVPE